MRSRVRQSARYAFGKVHQGIDYRKVSRRFYASSSAKKLTKNVFPKFSSWMMLHISSDIGLLHTDHRTKEKVEMIARRRFRPLMGRHNCAFLARPVSQSGIGTALMSPKATTYCTIVRFLLFSTVHRCATVLFQSFSHCSNDSSTAKEQLNFIALLHK